MRIEYKTARNLTPEMESRQEKSTYLEKEKFDLFKKLKTPSIELVREFINIYPDNDDYLQRLLTLFHVEKGVQPEGYEIQQYLVDLPRYIIDVSKHYYYVKRLFEEKEAKINNDAEKEIRREQLEEIKAETRKSVAQITEPMIRRRVLLRDDEDYWEYRQLEYTLNILERVLSILTYMTKNFELLVRIEEVIK